MKLIAFCLTVCGLHLANASSAQRLTLQLNKASFEDAMLEIRKQTSYLFLYDTEFLKKANPVTVKSSDEEMKPALDKVFADQPFTYEIVGNTIVVRERNATTTSQSRISVRGRVIDASGNGLAGATVRIKGNNISGSTDRDGYFALDQVPVGTIVEVSFIGFKSLEVPVGNQLGTLTLTADQSALEAVEVTVLNTGYYQLPKERATGSFTHIDQELLNRTPGGNILQRLEGIANGVQFLSPGSNNPLDIRVRGLSTINANRRPLIVIDNFPYSGNFSTRAGDDATNHVDLSFINPNDIESITILKDAAAASIWGARAGNGVIVITTKKGRYGQKSKINFSHNTSITDVPDLLYNRSRLPSETVMSIEKQRWEGGDYAPGTNQSPAPEYVELLKKRAAGTISEADFLRIEEEMRQTEVRHEIMDRLYRPAIDQQYAFNVSGGGNNHTYYASANYDRTLASIVGNDNNRLNLSMQNTFTPVKNLEFNMGLWYSQMRSKTNGISEGALTMGGLLSPYMRLADAEGNALPIIKDLSQVYKDNEMANGIMDWNYRPLEEIGMNNDVATGREVRVAGGLKYKFLKHFDINAQYQYNWGTNTSLVDYAAESYEVRHLVNRFTQEDGEQIIPYGPMRIARTPFETRMYSGRAQLNYQQDFGSDHSVTALGGAEIREDFRSSSAGYRIYKFDKNILEGESIFDFLKRHPVKPTGTQSIPSSLPVDLYSYTDRFLSYFGNASYTYSGRYTLTSSLRWDASNLFGVNANQKGTPLWSIGGSWEINKEDFYDVDLLPALKLRATYGSAGNVYNLVSSFPTVRYNTALPNYIPQATIMSAGNPSLKWEQVKTFNAGLDFSFRNNRVSGSFDYFVRNASDLIGEDFLAPSTGIITGGSAQNTKLINYADMKTHGLDFELHSRNLTGAFSWNSTLLMNYVRNEITNIFINPALNVYPYYATPAAPVIGLSRDVLYANPWYGLDPENGSPILFDVDGNRTTNYQQFVNSLNQEKLINTGVSVPPFFGSLRNDFSWKNISLSALITWKTGHVFRRTSISPGAEFNGTYHMDYFNRWEKSGDEAFTQVPATTSTYNNFAATYYSYSESLITKGDLIRLQDISLGYTLTPATIPNWPVQRIRVFAQARNLGLLWKANKLGIDPDFASGTYVTPRNYSIGVQVDF